MSGKQDTSQPMDIVVRKQLNLQMLYEQPLNPIIVAWSDLSIGIILIVNVAGVCMIWQGQCMRCSLPYPECKRAKRVCLFMDISR